MERVLQYSSKGPPAPVITTAPHPRNVARVLARQLDIETCGFFEANPEYVITCDIGYKCARDPAFSAAFCCPSSAFPDCSIIQTACLDSTAAVSSCGNSCFSDPGILKCTDGLATECQTDLYTYNFETSAYTGFLCAEIGGTANVYDYIISDDTTLGSQISAPPIVSYSFVVTSAAPSTIPPVQLQPTSLTTAPNAPAVAPTTSPTPTPPPKHGISGGAIAGIVVGVLGAILILVGMILFYRFHRRRQDQNAAAAASNQPPPMSHPPGFIPATSPHPQQPASQFNTPSAPSYTSPSSSTHPLAPQQPQQAPMGMGGMGTMNQEVGPADSASQVGGPTSGASNVSYNPQTSPPPVAENSPNYFTSHSVSGSGLPGSPTTDNNTAPQSGLGPLPTQFQHQQTYTTGAAGGGGGTPGAASTIGPGSAFASIPPAHAPGVFRSSPPSSPPPPQNFGSQPFGSPPPSQAYGQAPTSPQPHSPSVPGGVPYMGGGSGGGTGAPPGHSEMQG